ncbi:IPT/TIG domain-containing protein [Kitasatospora aureofaciens]|uniref:IPT/TIG domain-containing protein n=1 Tax=Kitasatospora aureofaciens TaxID=1894 RepID=UPI000997F8F1
MAPVVTSVSPAQGAPAGGTSVIITGSGFTGATQVRFGANGTNFGRASRFRHIGVSDGPAPRPPGPR